MTHICVGRRTITGSDNGLSPGQRQAIIWTNAGILWIGPLETNFSEMLREIKTFSLKKIRLKISAKCCPFRLGLNVRWLTQAFNQYLSRDCTIELVVNLNDNNGPDGHLFHVGGDVAYFVVSRYGWDSLTYRVKICVDGARSPRGRMLICSRLFHIIYI